MIEGVLKGTVTMNPRPMPEGAASADQRRTMTHGRSMSVSIDAVADRALREPQTGATELLCDVCDISIEGEPAGRGLYMWSRGDELRFEEPALCDGRAVSRRHRPLRLARRRRRRLTLARCSTARR